MSSSAGLPVADNDEGKIRKRKELNDRYIVGNLRLLFVLAWPVSLGITILISFEEKKLKLINSSEDSY